MGNILQKEWERSRELYHEGEELYCLQDIANNKDLMKDRTSGLSLRMAGEKKRNEGYMVWRNAVIQKFGESVYLQIEWHYGNMPSSHNSCRLPNGERYISQYHAERFVPTGMGRYKTI